MKWLTILFLTLATPLAAQYRADILGDGFQQLTLAQRSDYSGDVCATLVRRVPLVERDRAILYIHGYNDYFFQREMANRLHDSLYNFYAVDLRKYGRSLREGQSPYEVREVEEYFADIDSAIVVMRREGMRHITLMAHSTGGLTAPLYCHARRDSEAINGLILNSPFLDMNLGWALESVGVPLVSWIGGFAPNLVVMHDRSTTYSQSLLKEFHGEWEYDTRLKKSNGEPTTAGWVHAIHTAQNRLQRGLNIPIPTLVIYSDKSYIASAWDEECQSSDIVLDVKDIAHFSGMLGCDVTQVEIEGGMHDILLSKYEVRERAYSVIFEWLATINNED